MTEIELKRCQDCIHFTPNDNKYPYSKGVCKCSEFYQWDGIDEYYMDVYGQYDGECHRFKNKNMEEENGNV